MSQLPNMPEIRNNYDELLRVSFDEIKARRLANVNSTDYSWIIWPEKNRLMKKFCVIVAQI